ncbi:GNAT family N-acetyltransferase [Cytophagaceae bacterium 50C-KIRBA]|uniref:GNAT family N-acetyltransferase n=1 Tax=Aquirufa beregesia TaxID=2516556 RepID=A0ABX0F1G3_9BACT|nr:GNAT family N-acetyltransferase [Aquirufa beregesia]NGZ45351.1 GNAT family N-acetyltransferase [Aquirufa beregesia]
MTTEIHNTTDNFQVTFSPTDKQVGEIEKWLIAERQKTGDGFYCNWNIIKSSFDKNELATISLKNKTIGFATWRLTTDKTARIEITEVKPTHRKKGIGKKLTTHLLNFLKDKGVCVVDLQCSPDTSEPVWKRLGFVEFPDPPENYNFNFDDNKKLYSILTEHLHTSSVQRADETIELWNDEPYTTDENTPPTYIWNLEFIDGTRKLLKPIIHPAHYEWRLRWRINGKTIKDDKIKRFKTEIDFGTFIIIDELTL